MVILGHQVFIMCKYAFVCRVILCLPDVCSWVCVFTLCAYAAYLPVSIQAVSWAARALILLGFSK